MVNAMEVITTHLNADFDTLASVIAAKKLYADAIIVFPGGMEKGVHNFLKKFTIPHFSYSKITEIDVKEIERLIIVDTRQKSRIGIFSNIVEKENVDIHIYDHHPSSDEDIKGNLELIFKFGSTTTILTRLLKERDLRPSPKEATAMMMGIYEDTGSFTFVSTTSEDYLAAAYLLSCGADLKAVSNTIKAEMTAAEVFLLNDLNGNSVTHRIKNIDIVIAKASSEKYVRDAASLVHKMIEMHHMDVLFALIRMEGKIYLIARSRLKEVDIGVITSLFGGGGHPTAGSATIKGITLIEAEENLYNYLKDKVQGIKKASDIMSTPVKSVSSCLTLKDTKEMMAKFNLNIMPVVEESKLIGLISRQDIGKAIFHGLEKSSVSEFMTTDYCVVAKETPLAEVQEIIIEQNQKWLPVMKNAQLVGCITRTDIFRILHYNQKLADAGTGVGQRKNLAGLMAGRLPSWVREIIDIAGTKADEMAVETYIVGGFVRDLLLNRENLDIDIVVEGDGIAFAESLSEVFDARVRSHKKFGTAVVILPDGFKIDVASARMEFYNKPAALPTVEAGPLKLDLYRRDFTINSMAIKLNRKNSGELIDYFGGLRDLKEKVLRVLHSLSFIEDPTRAIRAIRFEDRLDFHLGKQSLSLIKNAARLDFFDKVSPSRIFSEFQTILMGRKPINTLTRMSELDILRFVQPNFKTDVSFVKTSHEIEKVFDWYDLLFKKENYDKWLIYLALLQKPLTIKEVEMMAKRIGFAAQSREKTSEIKRVSAKTMKKLEKEKIDDCTLYHQLYNLKIETLLFMMAATGNIRIKERISHFITRLRDLTIQTKGKDLQFLGIPPGIIYGEIQKSLLDKRLEGTIRSKEDEVKYIKNKWLKD